MINFKYLPISIAVATSLASFSSFAVDEPKSSDDQLIELTKRIQELENKIDENIQKDVKADYVDDEQPVVLTNEVAEHLGFYFSGYARYGAAYASGDSALVNIGSTGRSVGRLGNEYNGGEIQFAQVGQSDNGIVWDIVAMIDQWGVDDWGSEGGVNLAKMYAGATNIFESQPELYIWAGRNFHQRPQQNINDYFWMTHDGQGGGFNNLVLGSVKLDLGFVGQVDSASGKLGNDNGRYAFTSKLHGIDLGSGALALYANYGFASDADAAVEDNTAWQLGATLGLGASNNLVVRYADGGDDSVFNLVDDQRVLYASIEGVINPASNFAIEYLGSYKLASGDDTENRSEYSAIARPMFSWDNVNSTWLEAGYVLVDNDDIANQNGWKVTLSQNIAFNGYAASRPMVRFYVTAGDVKTTDVTDSIDTLSAGAMFEAWW